MQKLAWLYNPHDEHRRVGWLELFYDLVFVATLIELGNLLSDDVSVDGFLRFTILFIPVWWSWTGMTFYSNRFIKDDVVHRLITFAQIFTIAMMAISVQDAFGDLRDQFILAYVANRFILVMLYVRAWINVPETRPLVAGYAIGFGIAGVIWFLSLFVEGYWLWGAALLVDLATPVNPHMFKWQMRYQPHTEHMVERYGIFTIIVLGESFLKVIDNSAGSQFSIGAAILSVFVFGVACSMWWLYFDDISDSEIVQKAWSIVYWIYFHLPLAIGITAFGVAAKKVLEQPLGDPLSDKYRLLMTAAVVIYLIAVAIIDEVTKHPVKSNKSSAVWRAGSAVVIVAIGLLGGFLQPIVFTLLLAVVFAVQIGVDVLVERDYQRQQLEADTAGVAAALEGQHGD